MATHPNATIQCYALDMILNIHSDASYLSEKNAKSTAGGHYFLGLVPQDHRPILLNRAIHTLCTIIKNVCASTAEAELASMFMNAQQTLPLQIALKEMGHPQPPTPLHADNSTVVGIANKTAKQQKSRAMNMQYFWLLDQ
eukprot:5660510-Ditylum_brightwellii.AAC.1